MHKTLKQSTYLSVLSYEDPADIEQAIKGQYENFSFIENKDTDTQAFVCEDDKNIFVNVRGTEFDNLNDWFTNLDCEMIYPFGGKIGVHKGFYNDAESIAGQVLEELKNASPLKRVVFDGHSQGASVATNLALIVEFGKDRWHFEELNSIESPRCMNDECAYLFGASCGSKINRVVNNNDIVCRLPPRAWGYKHVYDSNFHYFKEDGTYVQEITAWELFIDRVHGRVSDLLKLGTDGVKDHFGNTVLNLVNSVKI